LVGLLVSGLIGWLLVGELVGWLVGWSVGWLVGWLVVGWLVIGWRVVSLVRYLVQVLLLLNTHILQCDVVLLNENFPTFLMHYNPSNVKHNSPNATASRLRVLNLRPQN